jgi:hypothetical protein
MRYLTQTHLHYFTKINPRLAINTFISQDGVYADISEVNSTLFSPPMSIVKTQNQESNIFSPLKSTNKTHNLEASSMFSPPRSVNKTHNHEAGLFSPYPNTPCAGGSMFAVSPIDQTDASMNKRSAVIKGDLTSHTEEGDSAYLHEEVEQDSSWPQQQQQQPVEVEYQNADILGPLEANMAPENDEVLQAGIQDDADVPMVGTVEAGDDGAAHDDKNTSPVGDDAVAETSEAGLSLEHDDGAKAKYGSKDLIRARLSDVHKGAAPVEEAQMESITESMMEEALLCASEQPHVASDSDMEQAQPSDQTNSDAAALLLGARSSVGRNRVAVQVLSPQGRASNMILSPQGRMSNMILSPQGRISNMILSPAVRESDLIFVDIAMEEPVGDQTIPPQETTFTTAAEVSHVQHHETVVISHAEAGMARDNNGAGPEAADQQQQHRHDDADTTVIADAVSEAAETNEAGLSINMEPGLMELFQADIAAQNSTVDIDSSVCTAPW